MKLSFILFLFIPLISQAQFTNWEWAKRSNCSTDDYASHVAVDQYGNVYIAGEFTGTFSLGSYTFTSEGDKDIYVAKYDEMGTLLWADAFGGKNADGVRDIKVDANNALYITGFITDTVQIGTNILVGNGDWDVLFAKYNENGGIEWAKSAGSFERDYGTSIAVSNSGDVLFTGMFSENPITIDSQPLGNAGNDDIFIASFNQPGNLNWARRYGGGGYELAYSIDVDGSDNIYVTGQFSSTINFGSGQINPISEGFVLGDIYVAKLDPAGNGLWANPIGGVKSWTSDGGMLNITELKVSSSGDIYVLGNFDNCKLKFHNGTLTSHKYMQDFIAKYNNNGSYLWSSLTGNGASRIEDLYMDGNDGIYLCGRSQTNAVFGTDTLYCNAWDALIAKYNSPGSVEWVKNFGGSSVETVRAFAKDHNGNFYFAGQYLNNEFSFGGDTLFNAGGASSFLVKISQPVSVSELFRSEDKLLGYPNPVKGIYTTDIQPGEFDKYTIVSALGQPVSSGPVASDNIKFQFNVDRLPPGTYILMLSNKEHSKPNKFLVER